MTSMPITARWAVLAMCAWFLAPAHAGVETVYERTYIYNERGMLVAEHGTQGQLVTYEYNASGRVTAMTDGEERTTLLTYDSHGRLESSTNAISQTSSFVYDTLGRLGGVIDPNGNATVYVYDGLGQLLELDSPDTGITTFTYSAAGLRTSMARANGAVTSYSHDGLGRVTAITAGGQNQIFTWDNCAKGKGRLCAVSDPSGTMAWTYDSTGAPLTQQQSIAGTATAFDQAYAYDGLGRLTRIDYPGGVSAHYSYAHGRLAGMFASVGGATQQVIGDLAYRPFGGPEGWTYGNGLTRTFSHDLDGRLIGLSTLQGSNVRQSLTYGYNDADEITAITNAVDAGLSQQFGYDGASRLVDVTASGANQSFAYDANGNRTQHVWDGQADLYGIDAGSNRLTAIAGARAKAFSYDANGNTVAGGDNAYAYDPFNRMHQVERAGITTHYALSALGQRVRKDQGTTATTVGYGYGPSGQVEVEHAFGSGQWSHYLRLPGGEPVALVRGGQVSMIHTDHLGRPEVATNNAGGVVWRASNYAFDRTVTLDAIGGLNLGFPGQYWDQESGLWYNYHRSYDPATGRYIESDPIGLMGGLNTYGYAMANPLGLVDPYGLEPAIFSADFWSGFGNGSKSVFVGLRRGVGTLGAASGLRGSAAHQRYWNDYQVAAAQADALIDSYLNDPCEREEINDYFAAAVQGVDETLEHSNWAQGYAAGRIVVGTLTYAGPFAAAGDFGYYVQQGVGIQEAIVRGITGGP